MPTNHITGQDGSKWEGEEAGDEHAKETLPTEHGHVHTDKCGHAKPDVKQQVDAAEEAAQKYPGPTSFVHLHTHTLFSTLDGVAAPNQYIERAKHFGMSALAITDHGSLAGLPDAYFSAKKEGVKLIPGIEAYHNEYHKYIVEAKEKGVKIGELIQNDPEIASRIRRNRHLIILAKNETGFKNLLHLTSGAWEQGFYYKPRIWMDRIKQHKEGLILLSGCLNGPISHEIMKAVEAKRAGESTKASAYFQAAQDWIKRFKDEFADDFYFEIQMPGPDIAAGYDVLKASIALAKRFGVKTVLTGDSHYLDKADFEVQRAMMAIDQDMTVEQIKTEGFMIDTCEGYMKSRAQFRQTFYEQGYERVAKIDDIEEACDNSLLVAAKCQSFTPDLNPKLPEIDEADHKLSRLTAEALTKRGLHKKDKKYLIDGRQVTYVEQVKIELTRIKEKKFSSYFLITRELVKFSRDLGYDVGPARGSAGGSLVCFLIGIHDMDPMQWGLSFDRFLSESRGGDMLRCVME